MLVVRRRRIAAVVAVGIMSVPVNAAAGPAQEGSDDDSHESAASQAVIEIDVDVAEASAGVIAGALTDVQANVSAQLAEVETAQGSVMAAVGVLAEKQAAVHDTEIRIEGLTARSDEVVVAAFQNPPQFAALDVLTATSAADATVKQTVLDIQADADADVLEQLEEERGVLEEQMAGLEAAAAEAEAAKGDAEAALGDLEAAVSQQAEFVAQVKARIASGTTEIETLAATDPARAEQLRQQRDELAAQIVGAEEAEAARLAQEALDRAAAREAEARARGARIVCPVQGTVRFTDTWGAARSSGRRHQGTDMMASAGTPTVAPVSGEWVKSSSSLGGLGWYVNGSDGDRYYGAHLSSYEGSPGYVTAGTVIGYVGSSGNASSSAPHLHFEHHPGGGGAVNPYPMLDVACPNH